MSTLLGEYALAGAMLTCLAMVMAAFVYLRHGNEGSLRVLRRGQVLLAGLLTVSAWGLLKALLDDNFTLSYVVKHSEKSLAFGYKAAAFWAGQEGSLLFWAWILGLMGLVIAWQLRKSSDAMAAISLAVMAAVTGFFTCVMLFAGNPFEVSPERHMNGEGLNPALQNLAMVFHPPLLFLGYAGYTAPFALLAGGLLTNQKDGRWLVLARPWMVYSWIMLAAGILLGAQWAYVELGWGGYWAWDPVENASLLPWLTGTALLHSVVLQVRRGIFKRWTASLTAASFFLCVLGTYLTRSGVIQSVHAFEQSSIGSFFLVFLIGTGLFSVIAILVRLEMLKAEHPLEEIVSREGFFMVGNVLLSVMTVATLVGTIYPLISNFFGGTPITVGAAFYNKVILPMALLLAAIMSTGPVLGQGAGAGMRARGKLTIMTLVGLLAATVVAVYPALGTLGAGKGLVAAAHTIAAQFNPWSMGVAAVIGAVVTGVILDVTPSIRARLHAGEGIASFARVFTLRPRHWGAQLAHLGLAAIVAGIAGSSLYAQRQDIEFHPASAGTRVGGYTLRFRGLEQVRRENHSAVVAAIDARDASGRIIQLRPERRAYDRGTEPGQYASEVDIRFGLDEDLYVSLAGWEDNGQTVTVSVLINPLVNWIWIGGVLLVLGGAVCMIPNGKTTAAETPVIPETARGKAAHAGKSKRERRRPMTASMAGRR